jgi:coenzyme F420-0:L-glutamate ligase/coenzyme F420-1:gamma-L-glutamate ligase
LPKLLVEHLAKIISPTGEVGLLDGDVVVVASKVVAKAEGRTNPRAERDQVIRDESVQVVATRGETVIVRNRHGVVLAAAGVDESNVDENELVMWPKEPDSSAAVIREAITRTLQVNVGVIVSDTLGRPWRLGVTDAAIGSAGMKVIDDLRGQPDAFGRRLTLTEVAVGDEIAAASELVRSKSDGRPVAVIRGLAHLVGDFGQTAANLVRDESDDLFSLGTNEAMSAGALNAPSGRRTVREFDSAPVGQDEFDQLMTEAVAAAITAPAPHHTKPWRFVLVRDDTKPKLLAAMEKKWREDLSQLDGLGQAAIDKRVKRGEVLHRAPKLVVPCLVRGGQHDYPDTRRAQAERDMFTMSAGAAIENLLIYLAARGWGTAWVSSAIFCPDEVVATLNLDRDWEPLGVIAIGKPKTPNSPRPLSPIEEHLISR